jgi:hypothetical protein
MTTWENKRLTCPKCGWCRLVTRWRANKSKTGTCARCTRGANAKGVPVPFGLDASAIDPRSPTTFRPGSPEHTWVISQRAKMGLPLHLPGDVSLRDRWVDPRFIDGGVIVASEDDTEDDTEEAA